LEAEIRDFNGTSILSLPFLKICSLIIVKRLFKIEGLDF